jgi:hypothetical protein
VLGWRHGAQVRLEGHVTEILEREDPEIAGVSDDRRDRDRHLLEQPRDVDERQRVEIEGAGIERQHDRRRVRDEDTIVTAVGGVARERHDARRARRADRSVRDTRRCASR